MDSNGNVPNLIAPADSLVDGKDSEEQPLLPEGDEDEGNSSVDDADEDEADEKSQHTSFRWSIW